MKMGQMALVCGAVALGVAMVVSTTHKDTNVALLVGAKKEPDAGQLAHPAPLVPAHVTAGPGKRPSAAMRKRFEQADSYAAFIYEALKRPEEGGRFYALMAHRRCADVAVLKPNPNKPLVGSGEMRAAAMAAVEDVRRRCEGVADHFPDEEQFKRMVATENARGTPDILMSQYVNGDKGSDPSLTEIHARALTVGDPYLMAEVIAMAPLHHNVEIDERFASKKHAGIAHMAASAVQCELVGDCSNSYRSLNACYAEGQCSHADYRDFVTRRLTPERKELYEKARKAYLKLAGIESRT